MQQRHNKIGKTARNEHQYKKLAALPVIGLMLLGQACGGGSSGDTDPLNQGQLVNQDQLLEDPVLSGQNQPLEQLVLDASSQQASYRVSVRNFWSADMYPQEFPDNAHFSLFGGAVHDSTFSMWGFAESPSAGIEDMAETGQIDILLFDEVAPEIETGGVDALIEVREFTAAAVGDVPGEISFELTVTRDHPLVSMVSMLGPSPDWFVGVDGQSLLLGDEVSEWAVSLVVPLPLYDGGSKSDIIPVMGGPDIIPPNPVSLVAYDSATGTYLPSTIEQIVGELEFTRIE